MSDDDASTSTTCDSTNCGGCCDGNTCVVGTANDLCGSDGSQCVACVGTETCRDQQCQLPCAETCDGCCYGTYCVRTTRDLCGVGGIECIQCVGEEECSADRTHCETGPDIPCVPACTSAQTCEGGECLYRLDAMYNLRLISGMLPAQTQSGAAWDLPSGYPDAYVTFKTTGGDHTVRSSTVEDDVNPEWNEVLVDNISGTDLVFRGLEVEVFDEDLTSDESMGVCIIENFSQRDLRSTTPVSRTCITGAGWTLTFRIDRR